MSAVKRKAKKRAHTPAKKSKLTPTVLEFADMCDNSLLNVFECMDTISLAGMCKIDDRYSGLIMRYIIPYRTIDFSEFKKTHSVEKLFSLFGKSMARIIFNGDDIQVVAPKHSKLAEFLRILIKYGEPGKLKQVDLTFGHDDSFDVPDNLLQDAAPYFSKVQKLRLNFSKKLFTKFFKIFDKSSLNELQLLNIQEIGEWLSATAFPNLRVFKLCLSRLHLVDRIRAVSKSRLLDFISGKPASLIAIECPYLTSDKALGELSRHIPNMERLGCLYPQSRNNSNSFNRGDNQSIDYQQQWRCLNAFKQLKCIELASSKADLSDCGEVFSILAKYQTIEEMSLGLGWNQLYGGNAVKIADLERLTRLATLHLNIADIEKSREFVNTLFVNLPVLTTCTIKTYPRRQRFVQGRIIELLELAPNLKVLKLNKTAFSAVSVPFYKKLVKLRKPPKGQKIDKKNRLVVHIDADGVSKCVQALGKSYKPQIVTLQNH